LNVQIPYEVPPGPATLTISNAKGQIGSQPIYVNAVAPGIFLAGDRRHIAPSAAAKPGFTSRCISPGRVRCRPR